MCVVCGCHAPGSATVEQKPARASVGAVAAPASAAGTGLGPGPSVHPTTGDLH